MNIQNKHTSDGVAGKKAKIDTVMTRAGGKYTAEWYHTHYI